MIIPELTDNRIRLRSIGRSDIPELAKHANERLIARFMPSIAHPYTQDHARRWVNRVARMARNDTAYHWGVEPVSRPGTIGMVGLKNVNARDRNGELEYWLGKTYRGQGYASAAMALLLHFAFCDLRLHRVYAVVLAPNTASIRLLERHGFVREGVMREAFHGHRQWLDVYGYGLLATDYRSAGSK